MIVSISTVWSDILKHLPWVGRKQASLDVLTAFIKDAEHELLSLVTVLQAQIALLKSEELSQAIKIDRFPDLNRAINRLIVVTDFLASISEHATNILPKQKVILEELLKEVAADTKLAFTASQVSFSYKNAGDTYLFGLADSLKTMVTSVLLTVLDTCHKLETIDVISLYKNQQLSLSFSIGSEANEGQFTPWQLGNLRQLPTDGEGIELAAVDAMARLSDGNLSESTYPDFRHAYKLTFAA